MDKTESLLKSKVCSKCGITLEAVTGNFYKDSSKKDGLSPACSNCCRKKKKETYVQVLSFRLKEERKLKREEYFKSEEYQLKQKESKLKEKLCKKRYRDKNRIALNEKARLLKKRKPTLEKRREYKARDYEKMKADPYRKHVHYMRTRMNDVLNKSRKTKNFSVSSLILFTRDDLTKHLESLFTEGMNWKNYGRLGWHIDHIKPLAAFDLTNETELKEAFSLKNLQPLFSKDNASKGSYYEGKRFYLSKPETEKETIED